MMIWKYEFPMTFVNVVNVPRNPRWLSALVTLETSGPETVAAYAVVDPSQPLEERTIIGVQTGDAVFHNATSYIGTVRSRYGIVWHLFDATVEKGQTS